MARPSQIEFAGALYHVTARGDRREPIYEDDEGRRSRAPADRAGAQGERDRAILAAHDTGCYSYGQIGKHFGGHFTTVGRVVQAG
jgi:hypothetical protein